MDHNVHQGIATLPISLCPIAAGIAMLPSVLAPFQQALSRFHQYAPHCSRHCHVAINTRPIAAGNAISTCVPHCMQQPRCAVRQTTAIFAARRDVSAAAAAACSAFPFVCCMYARRISLNAYPFAYGVSVTGSRYRARCRVTGQMESAGRDAGRGRGNAARYVALSVNVMNVREHFSPGVSTVWPPPAVSLPQQTVQKIKHMQLRREIATVSFILINI